LPTFTGTVATPVTYQAKDALNRFVNTTITPRVDPPTAPVATPETQSVLPGSTATFTTVIGANGLGTGTGLQSGTTNGPCLVDPATSVCGTSVNIPGEGTWTINQTTGVVTFAASSSIAPGIRTPVTYRITDIVGQTTTSTLTPVVPPAPDAKNDISTGPYDTNQVIVILGNDDPGHVSAPLVPSSVKLCGVSPVETPNNCTKTSVTVPGEGTYTVNANGTVTFDPLPTFIGTVATPVTYQVADTLGQIDSATITPTVTAPPINVVDDTKTGPYDTNQVIAVLTNDTPSAQWVPSSVKLCGVSPVETPNNCTKTSVTVPGEGTYTVNPDGTVTFDPLPTFVGTVVTPVTYQVTDVLGRTSDADIRPTVLPPPPPIAAPETRLVVPSGTATFTNVIGTSALASGVQLQTGSTNGPCLVDPLTSVCGTTVVIAGEGTWTIDRTTGVATFVAEAGITTGPKTSVTYRVTDFAGQTATSTLTPIVPPPPSATDDFSSGPFDTNQSLTPFSNDSFDSSARVRTASLKLCSSTENPNGCTQTSVVVPNEGTYTVNSDGTVTFDPLPTFYGPAAPMPYQAEDIFGRFVDATLNPSVSQPNAPVALPETKIVLPGGTITFTNVIGTSALATGAQLQSGATNGPCLVDPATSLCGTTVVIAGEGTWTIDQTTGVATFVAEPGITVGTKTSVTYRVTDAVGQTASSTLTPIVPPPPTAVNDSQTSQLDVNQTYTPLSNDSFSTLAVASPSTLRLCGAGQTPNNCDKTTVVVANEGTYTAYADGRVIFDPLPTFIGTATPISYQVADIYGRVVTATITPTILPPPVPAATIDTGTARQGAKITLSPWVNDDAGTVSGTGERLALVPTSLRLCGTTTLAKMDSLATNSQTVTCSLTTLKTADGTYTVDTKTGKVTFVHKKGFSGTVTEPVMYQIANTYRGASGPGIATSVLVPTIIPTSVPSVTVGNKVWRDLNGDGYQGPADRGIAGVTVTLRTVNGKTVKDLFGKTVKPIVTDAKGAFRFTGLPAGQYKVIVTYPTGFRPTFPDLPGREKNSSTKRATSKVLAIGESDLSLDFGMVPKMTSGLARTM
jgi:CshA-type fibril repeat protein